MWLFGGDDDEGMDLFIGNLPDKTSIRDIEELLGDFAADASFKFSNKLFVDGSSINFCVLAFSSKKRCEKAIKAIRHKKVGGEYLAIHEFHYRSYHNDRRLNQYSPIHQDGSESEHRHNDRRRQERLDDPFAPEAEVEETPDSSKIRVSGYNSFVRKG